MRIALLTDIYKPSTNGIVHHVAMLKQCLENWGERVWLFVPGGQPDDDEPNVIRMPGIPLADTGYHLSLVPNTRARRLLSQVDIVHSHQPFISGSYALYAANHYNIPLVFTVHSRVDFYIKQYLRLLPSAVSETALQTYFQTFSQGCSALVAPSESIAAMMREWGAPGRIAVIPNGIDVERFRHPATTITKPDLGLPADAVVAVSVGRMSSEKSLDRLLRLFRHVAHEEPSIYLLLVGSGPDLMDLRGLAANLGLADRVRFTGGVAYEHIPAYLHAADFFVSASLSEVHPLAFIEAAAAGLPALGFRSTGVQDIICDEETGLIAEDNDLSFGLRFVRLAQDPELRRRLGCAAAEHARKLSVENNARRLLQLYRDLRIR